MGAWWLPDYARTIRRCIYMSSYGAFAVYQLASSPDLQTELQHVHTLLNLMMNKLSRLFTFIGLSKATRDQMI